MKLDLDVVGDNAEILPLAFPDAEVGALEGKAAFKDAGIAVFLEREGGAYFFCLALDRQGAGHLIVAVAQRLYLAGFEAGPQIGRAHVRSPVHNAHLVCRLLPDKTNSNADKSTRRERTEHKTT